MRLTLLLAATIAVGCFIAGWPWIGVGVVVVMLLGWFAYAVAYVAAERDQR